MTAGLVHPVASFPLKRQTGTLEGRACGQTARVTRATSPYTPMAVGKTFRGDHSAFVQDDGQVGIWVGADRPEDRQTAPAGLFGVVGVAAGDERVSAVKDDGTVVSWALRAGSPAPAVPSDLSGVIALATSQGDTLALKAAKRRNGRRLGAELQWGDGRTRRPA